MSVVRLCNATCRPFVLISSLQHTFVSKSQRFAFFMRIIVVQMTQVFPYKPSACNTHGEPITALHTSTSFAVGATDWVNRRVPKNKKQDMVCYTLGRGSLSEITHELLRYVLCILTEDIGAETIQSSMTFAQANQFPIRYSPPVSR